MIMRCPLCSSDNIQALYSEENVPVFQNKVYPSIDSANNVTCGDISLSFCRECGFVWNSAFNQELLEYDENYQNEQGFSERFQQHLTLVCDLISKEIRPGAHVKEIGCGKAKFLSMMEAREYQISGYDPAYEGEDPRIIKSYYPPLDYNCERDKADIIILRHVLEHIPEPMDFLRNIALANDYNGLLYIEVPDFNWIVEHNALQDIFYEHSNYFTLSVLKNKFPDFVSSGLLFGGQYCFIIIKLESLRNDLHTTQTMIDTPKLEFDKYITMWKEVLEPKRNIYIWGAGAKGATFLRLIDPDGSLISGVIDINPKKQKHLIAKTGHKIFSQNDLNQLTPDGIIIMNGNYLKEIIATLKNESKIPIYVLGESILPVNI